MTAAPPRIFLIGYRGTGKSTVAQRLASLLGYEAIDADDELESRAGQSIADIFSQSGEQAFRDLESQVLMDLCRRNQAVIALGGGVVLREENRNAIAGAGGPVVWLTATPQAILRRLEVDPTTSTRRPNLTSAGGVDEILQLLQVRLPLYRECATLEVDTEGKSPDMIAEEIVARLAST